MSVIKVDTFKGGEGLTAKGSRGPRLSTALREVADDLAGLQPAALSAVASVQEATADGSDAATTQALANSLKAKYNTLQADFADLHAKLATGAAGTYTILTTKG